MEIKIETASIRVLDKLYEIEGQCFNREAFTKRQIACLLASYNAIALVAKANSDIAGFIITNVEVENGRYYGHIITINVAPNYRRKGIAIKMLRETEAILKEKGVTECHLEVREDNSAALKLYQNCGYQKVSRLEKYYSDKHGFYFKKSL